MGVRFLISEVPLYADPVGGDPPPFQLGRVELFLFFFITLKPRVE